MERGVRVVHVGLEGGARGLVLSVQQDDPLGAVGAGGPARGGGGHGHTVPATPAGAGLAARARAPRPYAGRPPQPGDQRARSVVTTHATARLDGGRPLVVQQSFPEPRPTTNPYIVMLRDALAATPGVRCAPSPGAARCCAATTSSTCTGPRSWSTGQRPLKNLVRQVLTSRCCAAARRRPARPWSGPCTTSSCPRASRAASARCWGWSTGGPTLRIALNDETPMPAGQPSRVVPHGHYRDWFAPYARADAGPAASATSA